MDLKKYIGEQIKKMRSSKGMNQDELAKRLNTTKQSVSRYENGERQANQDVLFELSSIFNVSIDDFFPTTDVVAEERAGYTVNKTSKYYYLPTAISAGLPLNVDAITNNEVEKISIADEVMGKWAGHSDIFITKIYGDSMNNIIPDGSLIAIKPMPLERLKNGDIVVYSVGYDYSVKHYYKYGETLVFKPNSINHEYKEQIYNINDNIRIHGKVVTYIVNVD